MAEVDRKYQGQFTINRMSLVTHDGVEADLLHLFTEMNVYEDLMSNSLSGDIHVVDAINMISNLPIVGGEWLYLTWSTAGKEDYPIELVMRVHRVGSKVMISEKVRGYKLYFTTPENFVNQQTQLVRCYDGQVSTIVLNIFKESFKDSKKRFEIEETKNLHSVIPCHWEPFFTYNYLSKLAVSKNGGKTGFLFYESIRGYHFKSIESLYEQSPVIQYGVMPQVSVRNIESDEINNKLIQVDNFMIGETGQVLEGVNMGIFGHQWLYVDVFNKKSLTNDYEYGKEFKKGKHVEKFPMIPSIARGLDTKSGSRFMKVIHPNSDKANKTGGDLLAMNRRHAMMHHFVMNETTITVPGDSDMSVGMVVEFDMPSPEPMHTEFKRERFYSGRSLVTAIRHRLTKAKYDMVATLAKDSLSDDPSVSGVKQS